MSEDLQQLGERPHWTVENNVATYDPPGGAWVAKVRAVRMAGHSYERWHVAIIDRHAIARQTCYARLLGEAARVAEGHVRARNAA